jgi:hypothetical protein
MGAKPHARETLRDGSSRARRGDNVAELYKGGKPWTRSIDHRHLMMAPPGHWFQLLDIAGSGRHGGGNGWFEQQYQRGL